MMEGGATNMMSAMFGGESVSDNWLQSRGETMGKDVMSMIIAEMYDDDEFEIPATTHRSRSHNPDDVVNNSGLAKGEMKGILGPLVAGIMNAMKSGDVKQQLVRFLLIEHPKPSWRTLSRSPPRAAKTKVAAATSNPRHRGRRPRAVPAMDGVIDVDAAATPGGMWGMKGGAGDFHTKIVAAVMKPVATGINKTLKNPKKLEMLADAVADIVPLTTVKRVMKTTLKPQYQQAARSVKPQLEAYGACAEEKLLEYLKTKVTGEEEDDDPALEGHKQRALSRKIAKDPRNINRDLLGPIMEPIIAGITAVLSGGDWAMMKKGLLWALAGFMCKPYCCTCKCNCGGDDDVSEDEGPVEEPTVEAEPAAEEQ